MQSKLEFEEQIKRRHKNVKKRGFNTAKVEIFVHVGDSDNRGIVCYW